jgi:hypothetical protein
MFSPSWEPFAVGVIHSGKGSPTLLFPLCDEEGIRRSTVVPEKNGRRTQGSFDPEKDIDGRSRAAGER